MNASSGVIAAFSEEQTAKLTGLGVPRLRYWDRTEFYEPSYAEDNKRVAFSRAYSFRDIVALRVLHVLREQYYVSLQHLREVRDKLSHLGPDPDKWTSVKLYPLNRRVFWYDQDTALPQEIVSQQYILVPIVLDEIVQTTKQNVIHLKSERERSQVGEISRSRHIMRNEPVVSGTRIPVDAIKRFAAAGYSAEQIIKEYPDLTERDISAALRYQESSAA